MLYYIINLDKNEKYVVLDIFHCGGFVLFVTQPDFYKCCHVHNLYIYKLYPHPICLKPSLFLVLIILRLIANFERSNGILSAYARKKCCTLLYILLEFSESLFPLKAHNNLLAEF